MRRGYSSTRPAVELAAPPTGPAPAAKAMADHVAEATIATLAQVPPGYRLVRTELEHDAERNTVALVSYWEPAHPPVEG